MDALRPEGRRQGWRRSNEQRLHLCAVRGDLIRILGNLMRRRDKFGAILIETTGLADPAPVAQTFFVDEEIGSQLRLDAVITVVDARHVHLHIDDSDEVKEQIWKDEGDLIQVHDNHACTATGLAWLRDARGLTTTCYGGVKLWRVGRKPPEKHFQWKSSFLSLSISPNDKHLAAGCQDTSLFVWNGRNDKNVGMSGYPGKISLLGWNASSRYLASGAGKEAVLWDFAGAGPAQPGTFGAQPPGRPHRRPQVLFEAGCSRDGW